MYIIFEDNCGKKRAIGVANSESEAWLVCGQKNSVYKAAIGIKYGYERYM